MVEAGRGCRLPAAGVNPGLIDAGAISTDAVNSHLLQQGRLVECDIRKGGQSLKVVRADAERGNKGPRGSGRCCRPNEMREDRGVGLNVHERRQRS